MIIILRVEDNSCKILNVDDLTHPLFVVDINHWNRCSKGVNTLKHLSPL